MRAVMEPSKEKSVNEGTEVELKQYYIFVKRHKWLILFCVFCSLLAAHYIILKTTPIYEASCTMLLEKDEFVSPITGKQMQYDTYIEQQLKFNTHSKLITSNPVIEKVVTELGLEKEESLIPKNNHFSIIHYIQLAKTNLFMLFGVSEKEPEAPASQETDNPLKKQIKKMKNLIRVRQMRDTRLMQILAVHPDPNMAKTISNLVATTYIQYEANLKEKDTRHNLRWLTDQLMETKQKLEQSEKEFQKFKQEKDLFSMEGKRGVIMSKIGNATQSYLETRNKRLEIDTKIKELQNAIRRSSDLGNSRSLVDSAILEQLFAQLVTLELEQNHLRKRYKEKHPKIQEISSKIDKVKAKIKEEFTKELENMKSERDVLNKKENILKQSISEFEKDAMNMNEKELQYTILMRNVETNKRLYNVLLEKMEEVSMLDSFQNPSLRITEYAEIPRTPVRPQKVKMYGLSLILGIMVGFFLSFFRQIMDSSLVTEKDIQSFLRLPVVSMIPKADKKGSKKNRFNTVKVMKSGQNSREYPILNAGNFKTAFGEAFRLAQTNLHFLTSKEGLKSIMITSATAGEGKTISTANLGHVFADSGKTVLMIDSDVRKPMLSNIHAQSKSHGLSGLLADGMLKDVREGNLGEYSLYDLASLYNFQKLTGILKINDGREIIDLQFVNGEIRFVNWENRPVEKRLATTLVRNKKITKEQAEFCLMQQKTSGQKLGRIILNINILSKEELLPILNMNLMETLRVALQMKNATFVFQETKPPEHDELANDPVDMPRIYKDMSEGKEEFIYLSRIIKKAIVETSNPNLFLMPSGISPPNPYDLISSRQMDFLFHYLEKQFDLLIYDSSPILMAAEASFLSSKVNGVTLIMKAGKVDRELMKKTVDQLELVGANIIGILINDVEGKVNARTNYYSYYGEYGYWD